VYVGCTKDDQEDQARNQIKIGATVRLRVHSSEIVKGRVVYLWEEKSVPMVRVASGQLVYNVPARMLADETKSPTYLIDLFDARTLQLGWKFISTL
jgi:hypothetical protein